MADRIIVRTLLNPGVPLAAMVSEARRQAVELAGLQCVEQHVELANPNETKVVAITEGPDIGKSIEVPADPSDLAVARILVTQWDFVK